MANTSLSANLNVNKFREIYDEVIEEIDREITIAIVGRGKVGKAEVGAWFLLNRDNLADGEVHGIIMGEYSSDIESSTAALSAADRADIIVRDRCVAPQLSVRPSHVADCPRSEEALSFNRQQA